MQELVTKNYNGFTIEFELIDGQLMANATAMCAAFGKKPFEWQRSAPVARYISALEAKREIPVLVETRQGGSNPGTWIHERLILKLAQWLDTDFEIWCDEQVAELLRTGRVELTRKTPAELILMQAQQLVDHEYRVKELELQQKANSKQLVELGTQVAEVAAKQKTIDEGHYTAAAWAAKQGIRVSREQANTYGRRAAAMSRAQGYAVGKVYDAKYVTVNTYHVDILRQVFATPMPSAAKQLARPAVRR